MLHSISDAGGLGFCSSELPSLLPPGYHGPLVVALDSNILIDFQQYGDALLNDKFPDVDEGYKADLYSLSEILNLWLMRDIRFIVTPRSFTDAKKATIRFLRSRGPTIEALAESLSFQFGDWNEPAPSNKRAPKAKGNETGLPDGADRDLIIEAQTVGAHVFLTRDQIVLNQARLTGPKMAVSSPQDITGKFTQAGVELFFGGTCAAGDCPYVDILSMPAADIGKWSPLLSIFEK